MAKRSKELFELLAERRGGDQPTGPQKSGRAESGTSRSEPRQPERRSSRQQESTAKRDASKRETTRGNAKKRTQRRKSRKPALESVRSWLGSDGDAEASTDVAVADAPIGKRRVNVSMNLLLFFVAAFVLTNIMSYMVGSMRRGDTAHDYGPLSVPLDQYWTIQVTRPVPEAEWQFAWDIQETLEREGYRDAEVSRLRIDGADYYRTIVGRDQSRAALAPLKRQLDVTLSKLVDVGTMHADPRLETAVVRQQEARTRTE